MSLISLPNELLEHICSFISFDDTKYLAQVCLSLKHFVVMNVFRRHIQYLASRDAKLEMILRQMKWSIDCEDFKLIEDIFAKLDSNKSKNNPDKTPYEILGVSEGADFEDIQKDIAKAKVI